MSTGPTQAQYEEVVTSATQVLTKFVIAFEKRWNREETSTRENLLALALAQNGAFVPADAEKIRQSGRDAGVICQLLEAVASSFGLMPEDPDTVRRYRNDLQHPKKTAQGQYRFMTAEYVADFLAAAQRVVKALKSKHEERQIAELAHYITGVIAGTIAVPAVATAGARVALAPPLPLPGGVGQVAEPEAAYAVEPPFPMPKPIKGSRKPLDPEDTSLEGKLSDDQRDAVERIARWFADPQAKGWFALAGAAGTGKTTVTGAVVRRLNLLADQVRLVAPTGKAVEALKDRLPRGWKTRARTLAGFLWKFKMSGFDGEDVKFVLEGPKPAEMLRLVIVDEASMVTKRDFEALKKYARVLYTGDPHQLPPVVEDPSQEAELGACGVLEKPDAELKRIHRHGVDTSLHGAAHGARAGAALSFGTTADGRVTYLSEADGHFGPAQVREIIESADVVLTQRNSLRVQINEYVRRLRGFMTTPVDFRPKAGEILVASENYMHPTLRKQIANGERLMVTNFVGTTVERTDVIGLREYVVEGYPEGRKADKAEWTISSQMLAGEQIREGVVMTRHVTGPRSKVLRADWGYALTVHKAQGSEWPRVVVVDDNDPDHNVPLNKWYYVAYSRASEQLIVLRVRRETGCFGWGGGLLRPVMHHMPQPRARRSLPVDELPPCISLTSRLAYWSLMQPRWQCTI
ncbi:MAG: AAA family ATPase [Vicinamibacterales bacterium]